jgi:hypothetical protein
MILLKLKWMLRYYLIITVYTKMKNIAGREATYFITKVIKIKLLRVDGRMLFPTL